MIQDEGLLHKNFPLSLLRLSIPFLLINLCFHRWVRAFERWQLLNLCLEDISGNEEPLLLSADLTLDDIAVSELQSDLENLEGMNADMATRVVKDFIQYVNKISSNFSTLKVKQLEKENPHISDEVDFFKLTKQQLQVILQERRLPISGLKTDLINRLKQSQNENLDEEQAFNSTSNICMTEEDGVLSLRLEPYQHKPFIINKDVFNKLSLLPQSPNMSKSLIYCLLARYEALEGVLYLKTCLTLIY